MTVVDVNVQGDSVGRVLSIYWAGGGSELAGILCNVRMITALVLLLVCLVSLLILSRLTI